MDALPRMDFRLWHYRWPNRVDDEQREILVRALGGWLGRLLVYFLGGRWVPRKNVEESALDYSCSQFFRVVQQLAKPQSQRQ